VFGRGGAGVGDAFDSVEVEEAFVGEQEGFLFFVQDGVGDFGALQGVGVGAVFEYP